MPRWIGLAGKMAAGKDHTLRTMRELGHELSPNLVRLSFADILRYEIEATLSKGRLHVLWNKPYPYEIRRLLQWWGTDLRRADDPDYWVNKAEKDAMTLTEAAVPVFTDVRFPNEADMIRRNGGVIVQVVAPEWERALRLRATPPQHESETALDGYDFDIKLVSDVTNENYHDDIRTILDAANE